MTPYEQAANADIQRRAASIWAAIRYYQMMVDAFTDAGQPPPPPPPRFPGLADLVHVTPDGTVKPNDPNLDLTAPLTP